MEQVYYKQTAYIDLAQISHQYLFSSILIKAEKFEEFYHQSEWP
jgi:hypothetical protein